MIDMRMYEGKPMLCVGGPLDGQRIIFRHRHVDAIIPQSVAEAWGLGQRPYMRDILITSYETAEVEVQLPGLRLSGVVYSWKHNKDVPAQVLMKVLASVVMLGTVSTESEPKPCP